MKKLVLKNESFQILVHSYRDWLSTLGYASSTTYYLPIHLQEFFYYLEQRGHRGITTITTQIVSEYYTILSQRTNHRRGGGLSKAYLNKHQQALKKFLEYLKEHNVPFRFGVHLKGEKTSYIIDKVILSPSEVKTLFEACSYTHMDEAFQLRDRAVLVLLYSCGLRRNEVVHVNCEDVLFEQKRIYVRQGKNYKERLVPINGYNLELLESYLYEAHPSFFKGKPTDALLLNVRGERMGDQTLFNRLKAIIEASEDEVIQAKGITPHTMRHSIATHLMQSGVPIQSIATFLGHTTLESTQVYTHLMETQAKEQCTEII